MNTKELQEGKRTKLNKRLPITVVIPVKNEERNLPRCLSRLSRFECVVIVDSQSTDRTTEIAKKSGIEILQFFWDGGFPKKRNWLLLNHSPKTPWVLFLDADEIVGDSFCDEVASKLKKNECNGYWLNYTNYFMDCQLRYGLKQRKLALFKVGAGLYERIEENSWSKLDMEVHEHPAIDGTVGNIMAPIEHNDYRGIAKFIDRHLDYARWEAHRYLSLSTERQQQAWTWRQRFKYKRVESWWYCWAYFCFTYFFRLGVLDGPAGFHYALYKVWYFRTIRLLIREARLK